MSPNEEPQVLTEPLLPPTVGQVGYTGLNPHTEVLPAGWVHPNHPKARALTCDILVEHDVAVTMRDGARLYADIYRPANSPEGQASPPVPAVICWSPFGKKANGIEVLRYTTPWNLGLPDDTLSGLEKFEAPDPAEWVPRGYAIVNIDNRGCGDSEGIMACHGFQESYDGHDTVEHIAALPWCSGSVGLAGNSHLAIAMWGTAAQRPPSLKAIAPWEGCGDLYREHFARGGIYCGDMFDELIVKHMLRGRNGIESPRLMFERSPLMSSWWAEKRPDMSRINIPTYITGTWTNTMHGMGSIRGWLEAGTQDKWLRFHPWQEWYDLWGDGGSRAELLRFMDRYLKGERNGWEDDTPRVRMALLRFGNKTPQSHEGIVETAFPPERTRYVRAFLRADGTAALEGEGKIEDPESVVKYDATSSEGASFTHRFTKTTRIMGLPKAVLYMSCPDHDDLDVYVTLEKLDAEGRQMENLNIPWRGVPIDSIDEMTPEQKTEVVTYKGPMGVLRASHRAIDEAKSMHPHWPFHPHDREDKIAPGTVVRLDVGIWAMGIEYEAGEQIRIVVSGRSRQVSNFGSDRHSLNRGKHLLHLGGEYASHVVLPFV
ncbi:X-Pro dipeptidyl-peptidase C-terminal non-catalytic domain-containing protein [Plectosphaerella plurivora]|uniref:X-Pro dipeptidyl-peptidase C-terminal non-catalytic domain-containing protein n=1 Tax=Plectosphaerella plurivora TaxID=936078 RepID=A0A9P9AAI2_9PEZI|nr:X-Pro dipeptidyl-peptidase C-terminal non-catalytic domain-containing protein [Plectosphaerella plurivora]